LLKEASAQREKALSAQIADLRSEVETRGTELQAAKAQQDQERHEHVSSLMRVRRGSRHSRPGGRLQRDAEQKDQTLAAARREIDGQTAALDALKARSAGQEKQLRAEAEKLRAELQSTSELLTATRTNCPRPRIATPN